jgi:hypothetical protein
VVVSKEKYDHLVRLAESEYGPDSTDLDFVDLPESSVVVDRARFDRLLACAKAVQLARTMGASGQALRDIFDAGYKLIDGDLDPLP